MMKTNVLFCWVLAVACSVCSCSTPSNPWVYNTPPTAAAASSALTGRERPVVVVGRFDDPSKAPNYSSGVGRCLSEALSRALLHDGQFEVWINPQLSLAVEQIIERPTPDQAEALGDVRDENPKVNYVITGKVTDFHHTSDLPEGTSRWGIFGRRNEAIVAIDLRIVDLRTKRIVGAHHVQATARAKAGPSGDVYGGVALDSYLFWSTPLGRASKNAIENAVARASRVVPGRLGDTHIARIDGRRRVSISGGALSALVEGREYFLVQRVQGGDDRVIYDHVTGQPLMVRISDAGRSGARGWLRGEAADEADLRGAVLRSTIAITPNQSTASATDSRE